ncbi:MAG: hypothetical protein JRN06_07325 [Nitrososphaerota archaeon]|nr:hypothetical protein [Nitrososphaerota archaeon]MDG7024408.1 hypothetical protein [Nitrososphaerota archaeon]
MVLLIGIITALGEIGLSVSLVPVLGLAGAAISRVTIFTVGCARVLRLISEEDRAFVAHLLPAGLAWVAQML